MPRRLLLGLALLSFLACQAPDDGDYVVTTLTLPHGDPAIGREVFVSQGCSTCHSVAWDMELPGLILPSQAPWLEADLALQSPGAVATAIIVPSHQIPEAMREDLPDGKSPMPDFAGKMTVRELIDVVGYLRSHPPEVAQLPESTGKGRTPPI